MIVNGYEIVQTEVEPPEFIVRFPGGGIISSHPTCDLARSAANALQPRVNALERAITKRDQNPIDSDDDPKSSFRPG